MYIGMSIRPSVRPPVRPSVHPSVRPSVHWSVRNDRVAKWKNEHFGYFLCMFVCGVGVWVWIWVGCPCPPVRNDIVTPRHLFILWEGPRIFFIAKKISFDLLRSRFLMLINENKKNFANPSKRSKDMTKNVMYAALEMVTKSTPFC